MPDDQNGVHGGRQLRDQIDDVLGAPTVKIFRERTGASVPVAASVCLVRVAVEHSTESTAGRFRAIQPRRRRRPADLLTSEGGHGHVYRPDGRRWHGASGSACGNRAKGAPGSGRVVPAGLAPIVSENADPGSGDRFGWAAIGAADRSCGDG